MDECRGVGSLQCELICPEVFQAVDNVSQVQVPRVPPELQEACRRAADACPSGAVHIIED